VRLGEKKQKIDLVINENKQISLDFEIRFNGQQFFIKNYKNVLSALEILLSWDNSLDSSIIDELSLMYGDSKDEIGITPQEHSKLNSLISQLNAKMPVYYSMLEVEVKKQDENIINIKLPDDLNSFQGLGDFNQKIKTVLKEFNIDGEFEFAGFDTGSSFLKAIAQGSVTLSFFILSLQVAQEYYKAKQEYHKSRQESLKAQELELHYRANFTNDKNFKEKEFKQYIDKVLELELSQKVDKIKETLKVSFNGKEGGELVKPVKDLATELENGTEFHLSLNPPTYAKECNGIISINNQEIKELNDLRNKEIESGVKQLKNTSLEEETKEDEDKK
jgi:hypothetical protein